MENGRLRLKTLSCLGGPADDERSEDQRSEREEDGQTDGLIRRQGRRGEWTLDGWSVGTDHVWAVALHITSQCDFRP